MEVPSCAPAWDFPGPMRLLMELVLMQGWGQAALLAREAVVPGEAAPRGTQGHEECCTQPKHLRDFAEKTNYISQLSARVLMDNSSMLPL